MSEQWMCTLSCGVPLIVEKIGGVKSASLCWVMPCGAAADPAGCDGASAMWEELLQRGAGERDSRAFADAADRIGMARSVDASTLMMRVSATMLGERIEEAAGLLADMVLRPRFEDEAIEPSRELALSALESLKDDPQQRVSLLASARHLPDPFGRSGLGTEAGLKALTREKLVEGWRANARPTAAPGLFGSVITAAGAVDGPRLRDRLEKLLEGWSGSARPWKPGPAPARGYVHEEDDTNQVQIVVAHDAPPETSDDSVREKLVLDVLSGGMAGRLFSEVREKRGLCYAVSAGYRGDRDFGVVSAYVGTTPEKAQQSLDVLLEELRRPQLASGRITPDEFARAVVGMKTGLVFSGESTAARAAALAADQRRLGRPRSLAELTARIDALTLDDVNAYLARRELGALTVVTLGPRALELRER